MEQTTNHKTAPFGDVDYWLSEWLKGSRREAVNTHEAYRRDVGQFLNARQKPFDQVAVGDFLEYQSSLSDSAPRTLARKMASLRSFYKFLCNREVLSLNLARIETPRAKQSVNHDTLLTEKEIVAIIEAATDHTHRVFVRFLYLTAVRVSEALNCRWRDITLLETEGAEAHIVGKGNKRRDVFIPPSLHFDLALMWDESMPPDAPLFPSIKNRVQALRIVQGLAKVAKIEKPVSPHSFRHAHISHALKNGATLAECRDIAGHSNISTTSLYVHASKDRATATRLRIT